MSSIFHTTHEEPLKYAFTYKYYVYAPRKCHKLNVLRKL